MNVIFKETLNNYKVKNLRTLRVLGRQTTRARFNDVMFTNVTKHPRK